MTFHIKHIQEFTCLTFEYDISKYLQIYKIIYIIAIHINYIQNELLNRLRNDYGSGRL